MKKKPIKTKNLSLTKIGNPLLAKVLKTIKKGDLSKVLIDSFVKTMRKENGVGLAANQVGMDISFFVMECKKNTRYPKVPHFPLQAYFNPQILAYSDEMIYDWEGCLSIPGYRGLVPRAEWVEFEGILPNGKKVRKKVRDFEARVIQHEVDHLNGFFYINRMDDLKTYCHLDEFEKIFTEE